MFKRILLCGALALVSSTAIAGDGPAWGLIVKLKPEAQAQAASAATPARAQALAIEPAARSHARLQTAMQRVGLGSVAHRALQGGALHHVGIEQVVSHEQAQALARQLMVSGAVEWAVPNTREHLQSAVTPNDGYFQNGTQWWAMAASGTNSDPAVTRRRGVPNLTLAWGTTTGSSTPIVAVLDTGLISHEDLDTSRLVAGQNFHHNVNSNGSLGPIDGNPNDTTDPGDYLTQAEKDAAPVAYANCPVANSSWHGTAVTGVIAAWADNNKGIAGANWGVRIMPVRIAGKCGAWESDIVDAMNWVAGTSRATRRADVINLSFGGTGPCDALYQSALANLRNSDVVVVVAAGNEHGAVSRPANCAGVISGVISVAALNQDGFKANYSNFGSAITISTVGGDPKYEDPPANTQPAGVWGPYLGDTGILTLGNSGTSSVNTDQAAPHYYYYAGTSLAAPIVSATVALMRGVNPSLNVQDITTALTASVRPHVISSRIAVCSSSNPGRCICTTDTCGAGILDADRALQYVNNTMPPQPAPENIDSADVTLAKAASNQDTVSAATATGPAENHGGGGGAFSALALLALAGATAATARSLRAPRSRKA